MSQIWLNIWKLPANYSIFASLMRNVTVHKTPDSLIAQCDYRSNSFELFERSRTLCIYF